MPEQNDRSMQDLKPTVWIGKQGCSETMIDEIVAQLKKRKLIKVKWLQSTEVDPEAVAARAKARLVEVRGKTMVLAEKGKGTPGAQAGPVKSSGKVPAKQTARVTGRSAAVRSPGGMPGGKTQVRAGAARKLRQTGTMKPRKK